MMMRQMDTHYLNTQVFHNKRIFCGDYSGCYERMDRFVTCIMQQYFHFCFASFNTIHVIFDNDRGRNIELQLQKNWILFCWKRGVFCRGLYFLDDVNPFLLLSTILFLNEARNYAKHNIGHKGSTAVILYLGNTI